MGRKGPLQLVPPDEFRARTSLALSSRSGTTLAVDAAYDEYYRVRSVSAAAALNKALHEYLKAHGGFWKNCERDKVSGGLLQWLYEFSAKAAGPPVPVDVGVQRTKAALDRDIIHSRYGVLYLLGSLDVELDSIGIGLESVSAVAGAIGSGFSTDMGKLNVKDSAKAGITLAGQAINAQQLTDGSTGVVKNLRTIGSGASQVYQGAKSGIASLMATDPNDTRTTTQKVQAHLPCTVAALQAAAHLLPEDYSRGHYASRGLQTVGAVAVGTVMSTVAFAGDVLYNVFRAVKAAVIKLKDLILERIRVNKLGEDIGGIAKLAAKFVIDKVVSSAAPFVGAGIDLARGVAGTFEAVYQKVSSWLDRRQISINPGHPEEIARTIEGTMEKGIFKGLWDMIAGAGKVAIAALLPGLGSLVGAVMTGVEWLVKFLYRIYENRCIKRFLEIARGHYATEKARATAVTTDVATAREAVRLRNTSGQVTRTVRLDGMGAWETVQLETGRTRYEPVVDGTGFIGNTQEFTEFFRLGCEASPIIPMLTLNSGMCGSLMTMIRMFDDAGDVIGKTRKGESTFDVGNRYFTRLKEYGTRYLASSGFKLLARDPNDKFVTGLLTKHVMIHQGNSGVGGHLLAAVRA